MNRTNRHTAHRALLLTLLAAASTSVTAAADTEPPEFDCLIQPHVVVEVGAESEGILESLEAERGQRVRAGQVVATLEAGVEEASVALARARAESTAQIDARQVSLAYGQRRVARLSELYDKRLVPELEKDQASTEARLASLRLREARENQRIAELELRRAQANLERRTIRSPVDGVVVERLAAPGESVEDRPILKLAQLHPLNVEVIVPVAQFGTIEPDMRAVVMPETPIGGEYPAQVTVVDHVIDAASGTFGVRLELPNPDHRLPAGLRCRVRIHTGGRAPGLRSVQGPAQGRPTTHGPVALPAPRNGFPKGLQLQLSSTTRRP